MGYGRYELSAQIPLALRVGPEALVFSFPDGSRGGDVAFGAPGQWALVGGQAGAEVAQETGARVLSVRAGVRSVRLVRGR